MRAKKNPNKGGDPKKQKKMNDRKEGHGSQPGFAKKSKKKFDKAEFGNDVDAENTENNNDNEDAGDEVEEEDTGPKFTLEEYTRAQEEVKASNSLLKTKAPRKIDNDENLVTKEDTWEEHDEDVPVHGKKGKKKQHKGGPAVLLEFTTSDSGPTADPNLEKPSFFNGGGDRNNRGGGRGGDRNRIQNGRGGRGRGLNINSEKAFPSLGGKNED